MFFNICAILWLYLLIYLGDNEQHSVPYWCKQGYIFVCYNFYDFNEQKFDDQTISSYDHTSLKEGLWCPVMVDK